MKFSVVRQINSDRKRGICNYYSNDIIYNVYNNIYIVREVPSLYVFWPVTTFMYSRLPICCNFLLVFHFVFLFFLCDLYSPVSVSNLFILLALVCAPPPGIGVVTPVNQTFARLMG